MKCYFFKYPRSISIISSCSKVSAPEFKREMLLVRYMQNSECLKTVFLFVHWFTIYHNLSFKALCFSLTYSVDCLKTINLSTLVMQFTISENGYEQIIYNKFSLASGPIWKNNCFNLILHQIIFSILSKQECFPCNVSIFPCFISFSW